MVVMRSSCSLPLHWAACWLAPLRSAPINNDADRRRTALHCSAQRLLIDTLKPLSSNLGTTHIDYALELADVNAAFYITPTYSNERNSLWHKQSINQSINQSKQIYIAVVVFLRVWVPMHILLITEYPLILSSTHTTVALCKPYWWLKSLLYHLSRIRLWNLSAVIFSIN